MLERRIKPEGGLVYCDLGQLCPEAGQIVDCTLVLTGVLPERRVAVAAELMGGGTRLGARPFSIPPHHETAAPRLKLTGLRLYLPGPSLLHISPPPRRHAISDARFFF